MNFQTTIVFLSLLFLVSCGDRSRDPDEVLQGDQESPYFWKVEKDGKVSYWLGTIHIGVALHEVPCSPTIQQRLEASDLVWTEVGDIDPKEGKEVSQALLSPHSQDFKSLSSSAQDFLKEKNLADHFVYGVYATNLELLCFKEGLGISALSVSMDDEVKKLAQFFKIPVKSLDDADDLKDMILNAFTKEDVEQQVKAYPQCPQQATQQVHQYKTGQLSQEVNDRVAEHLLKNRNQKWMKKFTSDYKNYEQIFIAAGALHFTGPFNLLDMLKEEGFDVQKVTCSP